MSAPTQEIATFEVKVPISHLPGKVIEVFFSKLIKSPEPLIFDTTGSLTFQMVTCRNCLNWSLYLRETLTKSKISKQMVESTLPGISEKRPQSSLKRSTEPCPGSVSKLPYDVVSSGFRQLKF